MDESKIVQQDWIVQIQNFQVKFPNSTKPIFSKIALTIPRGVIYGIFGETGCGKSTLAKTLLGFLPYTYWDGDIRLRFSDGLMLHNLPRLDSQWQSLRGRRVVYVPQDPYQLLNPYETIQQQLLRAYHLYQNNNTSSPKSNIIFFDENCLENVLQQVQLDPELLQYYPASLSAGQCQRIGLAYALLTPAELLIFDEPLAALDTRAREVVVQTLSKLAKSHTILLISHEDPKYHEMILPEHRFYFPPQYDDVRLEPNDVCLEPNGVCLEPKSNLIATLNCEATPIVQNQTSPISLLTFPEPQTLQDSGPKHLQDSHSPEPQTLQNSHSPEPQTLQNSHSPEPQTLQDSGPKSLQDSHSPEPQTLQDSGPKSLQDSHSPESSLLAPFLSQPHAQPSLLKLDKVTHIWDGFVVLHHIKLNVACNQWLYLQGQNGSGKTTLLNILLGLCQPEQGKFFWRDIPIDWEQVREHSYSYIHPVFQNAFPSFNPRHSVKKILAEVYNKLTKKQQADLLQWQKAWWQKLQLPEHLLQCLPSQLSYGQQKRLAILRAILKYHRASLQAPSDWHLFIMDEALSGIHRSLRLQILQSFQELRREGKFSMIWVGHEDPDLAKQCDIMYRLE